LFGQDRVGYWTRALDDAAGPQSVAPAGARLAEIQAELTDLERRLGRRLLNLEAEETTPALRKRIAIRVGELEDTVADRQQRARELSEQAANEAPTLADVAPLLNRLPILAGGLTETPSARCARGSTPSSWRSATNRASRRLTSRSRSAITLLTGSTNRKRAHRILAGCGGHWTTMEPRTRQLGLPA
jgi:hypothetical protein